MTTEKTIINKLSCSCAACGRTLTNPGYNSRHVFCCGKYRRWYSTTEYTYAIDDGRDARGRFARKPTQQLVAHEITELGGV